MDRDDKIHRHTLRSFALEIEFGGSATHAKVNSDALVPCGKTAHPIFRCVRRDKGPDEVLHVQHADAFAIFDDTVILSRITV